MSRRKNTTLELLKLFASYMVVFVHVSFPGTVGVSINALARFAVPFFFIVSGFYSYRITPAQIRKRIAHLFGLLVSTVVLYTCWAVLSFVLKHDLQGLSEYFLQYRNLEKLRDLILFNVPVHDDHLWYILAALYVYILFYLSTLCHLREKYIYIASFLLLTLHLVLNEGLSFFGISVPNHILRNFIFMGIPFFGAGLLIRKYKQQLVRLPSVVIPLSLIIGIAGTLLSCAGVGNKDLYLGSLFLLIAPVLISLKYAERTYPPMLEALTGCSTGVYISHRILSSIIGKGYALFGIYAPFPIPVRIIHPLLTCIGSTLVSYAYVRVHDKIKARK